MCGKRYPKDQITHLHKHCAACGYTFFENLRTSVGALIVKEKKVLLVKRAVEPRQDTWDVPGGFTEPFEHPEQTIVREVKEELGVACQVSTLFGVYAPNPYPYMGKTNYACDLFYLVSLLGDLLTPADDVSAYQWFPLAHLPPDPRLAFPTTRQVLKDLVRYAPKVLNPNLG